MDKKIIFLILIEIVLLILVFRTRSKKWINNLLLVTASTLFFLLLVEFSYRLFFNQKASRYLGEYSSGYYKEDSLLGYSLGRTGYLIAMKINSSGDTIYKTHYSILPDSINRGLHFNHRAGYFRLGSNSEIVFLGCSFTFGEGLTDEETLPYQFGYSTNFSTLNLGCLGYGTHQVYQLFMKRYANQDNKNRIFVYSFLSDHLLRANGIYEWNNKGPFFSARRDSLVNMGPLYEHRKISKPKWIHYLSFTGAFTFVEDLYKQVSLRSRIEKLSEEDYGLGFLMIKKIAEVIQRTGGEFVILNWDTKNWADGGVNYLPQKKIDLKLENFKNFGVQVITVSSIIDLNNPRNFIPGDGHPSALANAKIAHYLKLNLK